MHFFLWICSKKINCYSHHSNTLDFFMVAFYTVSLSSYSRMSLDFRGKKSKKSKKAFLTCLYRIIRLFMWFKNFFHSLRSSKKFCMIFEKNHGKKVGGGALWSYPETGFLDLHQSIHMSPEIKIEDRSGVKIHNFCISWFFVFNRFIS